MASLATSPAPAPSAGGPAAAFGELFMLLAIRKHRPEFRVQLDEVRSELAGQVLDPGEVRSRADLLPKPLRDAVNSAFARVDAVRDEWTVPFSLPGIRVLPRDKAEGFFAAFDLATRTLADTLESGFFPLYEPQVRQRARDYWLPLLGGKYDAKIGRHLPPLPQLRTRMGVDSVTFSVSYKHAEDADAAMRDLAESLRDRLAAAVEGLKDRLATGRRLDGDSFNELMKAIETMRGFSAFADRDLLAGMDAVEVKLRKAAKDAEANAALKAASRTATIRGAASSIATGLDSLLTACKSDAGVRAVMGKFGNIRPIRAMRPDA